MMEQLFEEEDMLDNSFQRTVRVRIVLWMVRTVHQTGHLQGMLTVWIRRSLDRI